MIRLAACIGVFGVLAACADAPENTLPPFGDSLQKSAFQTAPFAVAPIDILAPARHELRTLSLRPCGATVCGSRPGTVQNTAAGAVITNAYRGLTLTLAPGGGGTIASHSATAPIVWDFAH